MPTRRARVDALTDDVATLAEKVRALHEDFERALEELETEDAEAAREAARQAAAEAQADGAADAEAEADAATDATRVESRAVAERARADGGDVGWSEVETAGPDGAKDVEEVEWTPVDLE